MLDTTTGSAIDLAPVLNPLIQAVGAIIAGSIGTIAIFGINWVRGKLKMQKLENDAALQSKIDDVAQKIIGGAMARANIKPGQAVLDIHNQIVADAGRKIADSLGGEISKLGAPDVVKRAQEIVENRLGMMAAAAAGNPIPGPTATPLPAATPAPVPPTPAALPIDTTKPVTQ